MEDFVNVEIRDNAEDENISDSGSVHVEIIEEEQGFRPGSRRSTLEGVDKVKFSKQSNQENYDEEDGKKQQCNEQQTENSKSFSNVIVYSIPCPRNFVTRQVKVLQACSAGDSG